MIKNFFLLCSLALSSINVFAQYDCVYTAGFARDGNNRLYAAYWKGGQVTKLTNGTDDDEARTIAISGNDVHVGGFKTIGGKRVAAYWKNGREVPLNLVGDYSRIPSAVHAIKTVGNDVYIFVTQPRKLNYNDPNNYYYYYKNGVRQTWTLTPGQIVEEFLTNSESYFVTRNGDIYIANPTLTDGKVTYWKNGTRIASAQDYSRLYLIDFCSIFVTDNGDVYIAGTKSATSSSSKAAYWKNGTEVGISVDSWNTYATGIHVENGNVYISGYESRTFAQLSALYWKNGYKTRLHDYDTDHYDAMTKAIAVVNGTVYVAGSHKGSLYWVNGKEVKLDQGGETYAMTVVKGGGCFNNGPGTQNVSNGAQASKQQFNSSFNQAQNSLKSEDYTGAMQGYANAAISATNKNDQKLATAGVVVSGLVGLADRWQKAASEKRERERLEAEEKWKKADAELKQRKYEMEEKNKLYKTWFESIPVARIEGLQVHDSLTVQSIINRHIKAIGGIEKINAINTVTTYNQIDQSLTDNPSKMKLVRGQGKMMTVLNSSDGASNLRTVFNGVSGYTIYNDKKSPLTEANIATYKKTKPLTIFTLQENTDLTLAKELFTFGSGNPCYALFHKGEIGESQYITRYYFDSFTGLFKGYEMSMSKANTLSSVSYTFYEDYRPIAGVLFSFTSRSFRKYIDLNSYSASITETTEIKINDPMADKEFDN